MRPFEAVYVVLTLVTIVSIVSDLKCCGDTTWTSHCGAMAAATNPFHLFALPVPRFDPFMTRNTQ